MSRPCSRVSALAPSPACGRRRGMRVGLLVPVDLRQAFSGALTGFGTKREFVAARMPASARGQVAGAVRASPARLQRCPRALVAPPFSGPRSRGPTDAHHGQPRHHQPSTRRARTPRMGPAPGGTTTALCNDRWRGTTRHTTDGARAGGSGCGRRPHSRCPGPSPAWLVLMAPRAAVHIGCPASVGRRTYPGPPDLARSLQCAQQRTATKGRKQPFTMHRRFVRRESCEARWSK